MGRRAAMAPVDIRVGKNFYHMQVIQDRVMTPLVTQMALFSAIDATERAQGGSTFSVSGHLDFEGGSVRVDNVYSGDVAVPALASLGVGTSLSYAMASGFDEFKLKGVTLEVDVGRPKEPSADRRYRRAAQRASGRRCRADCDAGGREWRRDRSARFCIACRWARPRADQFHRRRCGIDEHDWSSAPSIGLQYHSPDKCWNF